MCTWEMRVHQQASHGHTSGRFFFFNPAKGVHTRRWPVQAERRPTQGGWDPREGPYTLEDSTLTREKSPHAQE